MKRKGFWTVLMLAVAACGRAAHPEMPSLSTRCAMSYLNGPPEVRVPHAALDLWGRAETDFWLEIEVSNEGGERHLLSYFGGPQEFYTSEYHWLGDLRGEVPNHFLSSENRYVLRGFRAPYENYPDFRGETPLFETEFTVPRCDG